MIRHVHAIIQISDIKILHTRFMLGDNSGLKGCKFIKGLISDFVYLVYRVIYPCKTKTVNVVFALFIGFHQTITSMTESNEEPPIGIRIMIKYSESVDPI